MEEEMMNAAASYIEGILPKGPYLPCLPMTDKTLWQDTLDINSYVSW